jgi:hypothetical protein
MNSILKLSEIEKVIQKKIEIRDGVPQWVTHKLDGDIFFYDPTEKELAKEINEEVIQKLKGNETEEQISFLLLPYITNVENDISFERFIKLMNSKNPIVLMLQEGVISIIKEIFDYAEHMEEFNSENKDLLNKIEAMKPQKESIEDKIIRLTKDMEEEPDTKKKKQIFLELAKLYEKVDNNG